MRRRIFKRQMARAERQVRNLWKRIEDIGAATACPCCGDIRAQYERGFSEQAQARFAFAEERRAR